MNVGPNDTAMLVHPVYPENKDRICRVVSQIPNKDGRVIWYCEFRERIRTSQFDKMGRIPVASIEDWRLMRLASPSIDIGCVTIRYKRKRREIVRENNLQPHSAV